MLLGTSEAGFLVYMLTGTEIFLIPPHPLTNFEIKKYHQNEFILQSFYRVYSRYNFPNKINDGAYVINLDGCADVKLI